MKHLTPNDHEADTANSNQNEVHIENNSCKSKSSSKVLFMLEQQELNGIVRQNQYHLEQISRSLEQIKTVLAWLLEETMIHNYESKLKDQNKNDQ